MTTARLSHLVLRRPDLLDLPALPELPSGYTLTVVRDTGYLESLAATLSLAFDYPWDANLVRTKLTEAPDVRAVYIITYNDMPVATASSRFLVDRFPSSGYVHWVGTHPLHTGRGLSLALNIRLLHDFFERGYRDAIVETDDFRLAAIKLYLKCGFIPIYDVHEEDHRLRWSQVFQALFIHR